MNKKVGNLLLASCMLVGVLSACSSNSNGNTAPTNAPSQNSSTETAGFADYSGGFEKQVTLDIPVYERAFEGWNVSDNYYTRWVQSEFGDKYNIKVNFVPINRSNEVQDYQQLLAAGKAPDIIFHYDYPQAMAYYGQEVMQEINWDEIANYAPTYWENTKEMAEQYGVVEDKNVFFFAQRPDFSNWVSIIRKDWVEKVGMKVEDITSEAKYNEVLAKWKEAGLGVGAATLPANVYNFNIGKFDWPLDTNEYQLYRDLSVADFSTPYTEEWLKNFNYQYQNGLIDQEFYIRTEQKSEFVAGRTGTYGEYITSGTDIFSSVLANNPDAEFAVLPVYTDDPEGPVRANWPFGFIMGINHTSTNEERIAAWMYLEWLSQPENLFKFQNGVEGQNYNLDENGIPVKIEGYDGESRLSNNNNKDYWALVIESPSYGTYEETLEALKSFWTPVGYEYIVEDMLKYQEMQKPYLVTDPLFIKPIESLNEYKADLNNLFQELALSVILAPEAEFDAKYAEAKKKYLDAGFQEIIDEKQAAIDAGLVR